MKLVPLLLGETYNIYALIRKQGETDCCPAREFLDEMAESSLKSMLNIMRRHAEHGPILNTQKSRLLEDGIFEFKSMQGDRLLYFYPSDRRREVIITHGFSKGARLRVEIQARPHIALGVF